VITFLGIALTVFISYDIFIRSHIEKMQLAYFHGYEKVIGSLEIKVNNKRYKGQQAYELITHIYLENVLKFLEKRYRKTLFDIKMAELLSNKKELFDEIIFSACDLKYYVFYSEWVSVNKMESESYLVKECDLDEKSEMFFKLRELINEVFTEKFERTDIILSFKELFDPTIGITTAKKEIKAIGFSVEIQHLIQSLKGIYLVLDRHFLTKGTKIYFQNVVLTYIGLPHILMLLSFDRTMSSYTEENLFYSHFDICKSENINKIIETYFRSYQCESLLEEIF